MGKKKTKVVLDADIINHFSRGGRLSLLPNILPEFQFIVLHIVNIRKLVNAAYRIFQFYQQFPAKISKGLLFASLEGD